MELRRALEESVNDTGFGPLKAKQQEALEAFVSGKDTFVALPTGYGKSIIYAILPSVYDKIRGMYCTTANIAIKYVCLGTGTSIVVCISPLTAIMIEQQQKFLQKGIKAEFVGEAQVDNAVVKRVLQGDLQLLYISPENLLNNHKFRSMLLSQKYIQNMVALVVDEAHCVKTW